MGADSGPEVHIVANLHVTGGVSSSARQLAQHVREHYDTRLSDPRRLRQLAGLLRVLTPWSRATKNYLVFNASSHRSLSAFSVIARMSGANTRTLVYLHGGRMREVALTCSSAVLSSFDLLAVTNERLAEAVHQRGLGAQVAAPHAPTETAAVPRSAPRAPKTLRILSTEFGGESDLYGTTYAIRAVQRLRQAGRSIRFTVVAYGPVGASRDEYRRLAREKEWFTFCEDLAPEAIAAVLREQDIVLRLTSTDGDSLIVREALAEGCRVIASSNAPRPKGVELCERDPSAIVDAITSFEPAYSSGRGLSDSSIANVVERDIHTWVASW